MSSGETKTGIYAAPERFNSRPAIYQHGLEKDERQVAEWYNTLSSSYDELYGKEQSIKIQRVMGLFENRRFKVLIDIGCGTGTFLQQAREIYDHGVGLDLSKRMLQIARKKKTPQTDFILASSSSLPIKNASVDCSVSISTTKSDANLSRLITDLGRIARTNSVLAVTTLEQPGTPSPTFHDAAQLRTERISARETLYFLGLVGPSE